MAEFRRLRTQAERAPEAWRAAAASRPGFATYPQTPAGDPSWWQRPVLRVEDPAETERWERDKQLADGPAPVDGETCKQWCGYCHQPAEPLPERVEEMRAAITEATETGQPVTLPNGDVIVPRRRWWHRYTRRG